MASIQTVYTGTANGLSILTDTELGGLADGSSATSAEQVNTVDQDVDVLVKSSLVIGATVADGRVLVYVAGSIDASYPTDVRNMRLGSVVVTPTGGGTIQGDVFSLAALFGGVVPEKWKVVVVNESGAALGSSSSNYVSVRGVKFESV